MLFRYAGPGHVLSLRAIGHFTDGSQAELDPLQLQWTSTNTTVAIVDEQVKHIEKAYKSTHI